MNIYESESMGAILKDHGYEQLVDYKNSDFVVINTCTVTAKADSKCRNVIRKVKRDNPGCCLIVSGCMVDTEKHDLSKLSEIDILIENRNKDKISSAIDAFNNSLIKESHFLFESHIDGTFNFNISNMNTHARAFIKIQDGCNNFCSYCKIPFARGRSRSRAAYDIIDNIKKMEDNGYNEVILTGINISDYQYEDINLALLLDMILSNTNNIRVRLSSLEPQNMNGDFFAVIKNERICPYFHLALQSGSDKILKLMNRRYDIKHYIDMIDGLRMSKPDCFISTDLIIGFPGETDESFMETINNINLINFSDIHVFSFSPREGTKAFTMKPKVPERIRDERVVEISNYTKQALINYSKKFINKKLSVLVEKCNGFDYYGKSENYLDVKIVSDKMLERKKIYQVTVNEIDKNGKLIASLTRV